MGYFDFLIDDGNEPKPDMEYYYRFHLVWKKNELKSIAVEPGIIVNNVVSGKNSRGEHVGYDFTIKGTTEILHCNYGWAFVENTPENMEKLKAALDKRKEIDELEKEYKILNDLVIDLKLAVNNE